MSVSTPPNKLLLIDGTAQVYRAFYAIKALTDPEGRPVNAVYGVAAMMLNLWRQERPTHMAVVFDRPEPTFRHQLFPAYKAQREKAPEDLVRQLPVIKALLEQLGFPVVEQAGVEADDIISTMATEAAAAKAQVLVVSSDKDLFQIVGKHVGMLRPLRGGKGDYEHLDSNGVAATFGVIPEQVPEVLALMGDSSDNIPGVAGIGPKTAVSLISQYRSLDNLYRHLPELKQEKIREKLQHQREQAFQSLHLVRVLTDAALDKKWAACIAPAEIPAGGRESLGRFGFKRLLASIAPSQESAVSPPVWGKEVRLLDDVPLLCREARRQKHLAVELVRGHLVMAVTTGQAVQLPLGDLTPAAVLQGRPDLLDCLEDENITKISYQFKPLLMTCYALQRQARGPVEDLHLAAHLLDLPANGLERFVERLLGPVGPQTPPGALACALLQVHEQLLQKLRQQKLDQVYSTIEMPLLPVLAKMEWTGVAIDVPAVNKLGKQLGHSLDRLEGDIQEMAGHEFNVRSPQQLAEVLFDQLQLSPGKKTKTGRSTSVDVLEMLAPLHPLPAKVLEYRKLQKIKSTYLDVLPGLMAPHDHRLHTTFHQVGAATGRLSSTDPNLQNIPVRTEIGQKLRAMFVPQEAGGLLLSADYSQIELRLLAHLSQDGQMLADFKNNRDIHATMAAEIFDVPVEKVTPDMRRQAKTCNFGIAYGVSPYGLAKQIGVPPFRAKTFIDGFYHRYPGVRTYLDRTVAQARAEGFVTTLMGRKRHIPEIHSANRTIREAAERMAINAPIQGSAADLIKLAMIRIAQDLDHGQWASRMILQVHDELLFEGPKEEMASLKTLVAEKMSHVYPLAVALTVDAGYGRNWKEAHS